MSERDEMRRLIGVIEKGAASATVEQNVEDLRLFANTASFFANKLDAKLKAGGKRKKAARGGTVAKTAPKQRTAQVGSAPTTNTTQAAMPKANSTAISGADYDRVRNVAAQAPVPTQPASA